jgi:hypothetical protein
MDNDIFEKEIEEPEEVVKKVKVQDTGRQFILQLPRDFIDALDIEKGDIFILKVPLNNKKNYSIKLEKEIN